MNKDVFKNITYGLYIVSSKAGDTLAGCIVNTVTQVTSKEPLIAVSINKDNYTNKVIKESKRVAISILSQNTKMELIKTFGFTSSIDTNKFANVNYEIKDNLPIVKENVCGYITGSVINIIPLSTHDIFLIKVDSSEKLSDDEVLTYQYYQKNMKGISPKKAPSYIEENPVNTSQNIYRCSICGYIYDDSKEKVKFADLPDDWVCPMCGVGKDKFEKIN